MPPTVAELAIAPVKGLRLARVDELEVGPAGPAGDRAFVVVDADLRLVKTTRTPQLLQVAPSWDSAAGVLELRFPDGRVVAERVAPGEPAGTSLYDGRELSGRLVDGSLTEALSAHLGRPVRLLALDSGQTAADNYPVTLMSTASLESLGEALDGGTPDPRRFRMTVTVAGLAAWEEHGWAGRDVALGEVRLRVAEPVPRCVVTTRDPDDGRTDVPVLGALARLRGKRDVSFGVWCDVTRPGRLRRGDPVSVPSP